MEPAGISQPEFDQLLTAQIFGVGGLRPTAPTAIEVVLSTPTCSENSIQHVSTLIDHFAEVSSQVVHDSSLFLPSSLTPKAIAAPRSLACTANHANLLIPLSCATVWCVTAVGKRGIGGTIACGH
ncbi:hypothetical protein O181_067011 [Austropuccinia psidii MF-1]|uniref:Uncharacterized protein n=1 Tax=Austropuccinia psidii MF-1 TaxID=1389203 RepID=A0A9Q3ES15_9BASI|nr:hypothetical protein [Austropuccinia psidii MF-1]